MSVLGVVRAPWRLLRLLTHLLHGLALAHWGWSGRSTAQRHALVRWWSLKLLKVLGIRLQVRGVASTDARLVVANHVSWLDIAALHSVMPHVCFVAKDDIRHWPVVGPLVAAVDTLFIARTSRRDAARMVSVIRDRLTSGGTVAVFPEGTTGPGWPILHFHANLLQSAIEAQLGVQPVMLRWHAPGERFAAAAQYVGDTTLLTSLWRILCAQRLAVEIEVLAPLASAGVQRRELADQARGVLEQALSQRTQGD
ncbi:lysophospholipid acyltransferase family protein [Roseateles sp. BYS180W]|uniref:Lysophospholipid acyltransferase family protein n=1 Tax=Roseateles rivi TaxID=3299028 RepID=A0ABW7FRH2_9BURK